MFFIAENNIIWHPKDPHNAEGKFCTVTDETLLARFKELWEEFRVLRAALSEEERSWCVITDNLCQFNGHFQSRASAASGALRFTCIQCLCVFDKDPKDKTTLNFPGGPRGELRELLK
jgi:hypothetical protein